MRRGWESRNKEKRKQEIKEWRQSNPDKVREYRLFREASKKHDISEEEKYLCKLYFDFNCAYCNMPEELHYDLYNQQLHMDHVDPNGANDLSNNIPSCRSCNSMKRDFSLEHFFTQKEVSDLNKQKIQKWLSEDYKLHIKR